MVSTRETAGAVGGPLRCSMAQDCAQSGKSAIEARVNEDPWSAQSLTRSGLIPRLRLTPALEEERLSAIKDNHGLQRSLRFNPGCLLIGCLFAQGSDDDGCEQRHFLTQAFYPIRSSLFQFYF